MKQNFLRRLSALALAAAMAALLCVPAWAAPGPVTRDDLDALELDHKLLIFSADTPELKLGFKQPLPEGTEVKWSSDDSAITVGAPDENGIVTVTYTGKSGGVRAEVTATVTHPDVQDYSNPLTCVVYGGKSPVKTLANPKNVALGETITQTIHVNQDAALVGEITFISGNSNASVVGSAYSISGDAATHTVKIRGEKVANGVPIFMRTADGQLLGSWKLDVTRTPDTVSVSRVDLDPSILSMTVGETHGALKVDIFPDNATDKTVAWSATPSGVVTVDKDGGIKAVGAGTATIIATVDGVEGRCKVTVKETASNATLKVSNPVLEIVKGQPLPTARITPELIGENKGNVKITWRSGNTTLVDFDGNGKATVETRNGEAVTIYGKKASGGPVTIYATVTFYDQNNKVTATRYPSCTVSVIDEDSVRILSMTLSTEEHTMPVDGALTLSVKSYTPANAQAKDVVWTSSDNQIAEVDRTTGKVTAHKAGQVAITATATYGGAYKSCRLTITPVAETIDLAFNYDANKPLGSNKYEYTFRDGGNSDMTVRANLVPAGAADPIRWASSNPAVASVTNTTGTQVKVTKGVAGTAKITAVPMDPSGKDRKLESGPAEITVTVSGVIIKNDAGSALSSLTLMQGQTRQVQAEALGSAYNGDAAVDWISSDPSVVSVSPKNGAGTTLNARAPGKAVVTATKGIFSATCSVTVTEDTAGVITAAATQPGVASQFSSLASSLQSACYAKTGAGLSYVTSLSVSSTEQGILHDRHYSTDDTGAGVGIQDRYYPGTAPQGQRSLNDLSFVPRTTFSGTAEVNYTAWSANNQSVSGVIRIPVNGTGDVMYSTASGAAAYFQASDFNRIHPNVRSVSFTLPQESVGTLYYKYTSPSQPGTKVTASTSYSRTGTPNLDDVAFVPAAGYRGTVRINYKGTDTSGRTFTGVVTVNVTDNGGGGSTVADISYSVRDDSWVTFRPGDFAAACRYALGETLSYVRFALPRSSDGTLFYNYRGFSSFDSTAAPTTNYYYSGSPALSGVSFVATTTTPGQVDIPYTGYSTRGNTFAGTVHISLGSGSGTGTQQQGGLYYTVFTGRSVSFNAGDFNAACLAATGTSLNSIQFTQLPGVSQGILRYTWGSGSTSSNVSTGTRFYRMGSTGANLLGDVYFQAGTNYTGTVYIPFTGTSDYGTTFTGQVTVAVTPPNAGEVTYYGTTANPIRLSAARISSAASGALNGTLSYITFNNLPVADAGRLYLGYSGFGTGSQVGTGTRYYASGYPSIDQVSFVPRGRYTGPVAVGYTAVSTSGQSVSGRIMFDISSTGASNYFNDLYNHTWAAPAVDYLYQNNVTKGTTATTFGPNRNIKRCDFVLMLCRAFKLSGSNGYSFADVPTDSYYSQAVATAKRLGIVSGSGTNFRPAGQVTRQDAMVMTYNALIASGRSVPPAPASVLNQFSDSAAVSSYARNAVGALVQMGAVNGSTSGRLNPGTPITRAEAAVILHFIMTM